MKYSIAYQQRAINEYEETVIWYRGRSIQAAENFEAAIKEKIDILRDNPARYKKTHREFHEVQLHKYPYNIIYLIDDAKMLVVISSIYHHKRNPRKK